MRIKSEKICDLKNSYAVNFLCMPQGIYGIAAPEMNANCVVFPLQDTSKVRNVWEGAGGTMSIAQIKPDGTFLAVQNFYKGFNSKTACIVKCTPNGDGSWMTKKFLDLPYVHRFDVIPVGDRQFILASTLCDEKAFKDDWSSSGRVWLGELLAYGEKPCQLKTLIPGITKNHGFHNGMHDGVHVVIVCGMEGLFEIAVPEDPDGEWKYKKLLNREVSEAVFVDIDEDGVDEIATIEAFHGNRIVLYKNIDGTWTEVYSYPVNFGHVLWGGSIAGKPGLLVGYRGDNAALVLFRKRPDDGYLFEHIFIDEHQGPTNICVRQDGSEFQILCSCGKTNQVVMYTLTEDN